MEALLYFFINIGIFPLNKDNFSLFLLQFSF